jgi:hypothetical protein
VQKDRPLKLYVWEGEGVLQDYFPGMACALARDVKEAVRLLVAAGINKDKFDGSKLDGVAPTVYRKSVGVYVHGGA